MKKIFTNPSLDSFFEKLRNAPASVLFLDYDGTLAPFCIDRHQAYPYPGVREILDRIILSTSTRLVIVSGRRPEELIPLLQLTQMPEIWGSHGWERRLPNGTSVIGKMNEVNLKGLADADDWAEQKGWMAHLEQKPACTALHVRGMSKSESTSILEEATEKWTLLAQETGLVLHTFDGGIELRAPGRNKGVAAETVLHEIKHEILHAYLGDDTTDEDAFKVIKKTGLTILVRPEPRDSAAEIWIKPPQELLEFLTRWANSASQISNI